MKRITALALCLLLLLQLFSGCGKTDPQPSSETTSSETTDAGTEPITEPTARVLSLVRKGESDYVIVYPAGADPETVTAIDTFAKSVESFTGVLLPVHTDAEKPTAHEIVVGDTNRSESDALWKTACYTGYETRVMGEKLAIWGSEPDSLRAAFKRVLAGLTEGDETGTYLYSSDRDTHGVTNAVFENVLLWDGGAKQEICALADKASEVRISETSADDYDYFLTYLEKSGFTCYDTNLIGENRFATYLSEKQEIHVAYYPAYRFARVVAEPRGYLPPVEEPTYVKKTDATLTQLAGYRTAGDYKQGDQQGPQMLNASGAVIAFGMSYLVQLEDGSFVMIDGGSFVQPNDQYEGNAEDVNRLIDTMVTMNRGTGFEKPQVTWIITHSHSDHMQIANQVLATRAKDIQVNMVCYNFPDYEGGKVQVIDNGLASHQNLVNNFKTRLATYFPKCEIFVFHAGQKLLLPGCRIDFLHTHEDYILHDYAGENGDPYVFGLGNLTTSVWKMTISGHTFLVMGDSEFTLVDQLVNAYGASVLKSDILQVTHHGYSGGTIPFSRIFTGSSEKTVCLWPTDAWRFHNDNRRVGSSNPNGLNHFNYLLRSSPVCYHFHAGHTVVVSFADLSVRINGMVVKQDDLGKNYTP